MVTVSRVVIQQKNGFLRANWKFESILVVNLADIRLWASVGFLIGCVGCTGCVKILFQGGSTVISNSMSNEFYTK